MQRYFSMSKKTQRIPVKVKRKEENKTDRILDLLDNVFVELRVLKEDQRRSAKEIEKI